MRSEGRGQRAEGPPGGGQSAIDRRLGRCRQCSGFVHDHYGLWCTVPEQRSEPRLRLGDQLLANPAAECPADMWPGEGRLAGILADLGVADGTRSTFNVQRSTAAQRHVPWCLFGRPAGCCGKKFECRRRGDLVQVVPRERCNADCPQAQPRLAIGAVVCAWNEPEVRPTVESLAASIVSDRTDLTIIVVDDGSSDGSCDGLESRGQRPEIRIVRHDKPWGLGRSRNDGWRVARELGCDVASFHDAHMRFTPITDTDCVQPGGLERLARRALQLDRDGGAFLCAGSSGYSLDEDGTAHPSGNRMSVCDLFWNAHDGLQPKWRYLARRPPEEWMRSPAPMGAGYLVSRTTAERLEAATGTLWDDTAGRWGFSEEAMGVKCFLLDVPIYFSADVWLRHCYAWSGSGYRTANPTPKAARERARNITRCMALLLGPEQFKERFRSWCVKWLKEKAVKEIEVELPTAERTWVRHPREVFTHLCGKNGTPGALHPHPEHEWWKPSAFSGVMAARILQWRPGESTVALRQRFPDAEIRTIELPGHRAANWQDWCKAHGVMLETLKLQVDYATRPLHAAWGKFDLVIVGGELQEACMDTARRVLKPGGTILRNESADRLQIADEFARKERELLAGFNDQRSTINVDDEAPAVEPFSSAQGRPGTLNVEPPSPLVTAVLLNWRRPENLPAVLDSLAAQTVPVQAYVWNNSPDPLPADVAGHPIVKLVVDSSVNLGCLPRWQLAALADTEFVCTLDDDLALKDAGVLADAIAAFQRGQPRVRTVGFFGWEHVDGKGYQGARHINGSGKDRWCDFVKGRFLLTARQLLRSVPLPPPDLPAGTEGCGAPEPIGFRADDIYVGLCLAKGEWGRHLVPGALGKRWKELGQDKRALASDPGHYKRRGRAVEFVRAWLLDGREQRSEARGQMAGVVA